MKIILPETLISTPGCSSKNFVLKRKVYNWLQKNKIEYTRYQVWMEANELASNPIACNVKLLKFLAQLGAGSGIYTSVLVFKNKKDALMFKMTWC